MPYPAGRFSSAFDTFNAGLVALRASFSTSIDAMLAGPVTASRILAILREASSARTRIGDYSARALDSADFGSFVATKGLDLPTLIGAADVVRGALDAVAKIASNVIPVDEDGFLKMSRLVGLGTVERQFSTDETAALASAMSVVVDGIE